MRFIVKYKKRVINEISSGIEPPVFNRFIPRLGGILPVVRPDNDLQVVDKEKALPEIRETKLGLIK